MLFEVWWLYIKSLVATIKCYWLQVPFSSCLPHMDDISYRLCLHALLVPKRRGIILAGTELILWCPGRSFISPNSWRCMIALAHQSPTSTTSSSLGPTSLQELGQLLYNILVPCSLLLQITLNSQCETSKSWLYSWQMQAKGPTLQVADCLEWAPGEQKIKSKAEKRQFLKKDQRARVQNLVGQACAWLQLSLRLWRLQGKGSQSLTASFLSSSDK